MTPEKLSGQVGDIWEIHSHIVPEVKYRILLLAPAITLEGPSWKGVVVSTDLEYQVQLHSKFLIPDLWLSGVIYAPLRAFLISRAT